MPTREKCMPHAVPQSMCQQIIFGTGYGTRKFDLGSGAEFLCKKSLFYGPVESYFAAYDSVVLTGPILGKISCPDIAYLVAGAKFGRAPTTLVESQRVETTMIVSWTHILNRCYCP
jgi:hypothetical protein